jgi:hypothetical protein
MAGRKMKTRQGLIAIQTLFSGLQRFSDARGFSIARFLKLKLELSTLDARR